MSMSKFGIFQIIGAAIASIGATFLIADIMACLNVFPMDGAGFGTAIICLLMATNGYLIMLYGISSTRKHAAAVS
jgi:hypothetical protein